VPWTLSRVIDNGEYAEGGARGRFRRGHMHGAWTQVHTGDDDGDERVVGRGTFVNGAGTWRSTYATGERLAEGPYVGSVPHGTWRFYHRSGNLAAEGTFVGGRREGRWTFYYDTAARTPIAAGRFANRAFAGRWNHFDTGGKLIATSFDDTPERWASRGLGHLLTFVAGPDKVQHQLHIGYSGRYNPAQLESVALDGERIYIYQSPVYNTPETLFDAGGHKLTSDKGTWYASDCGWSPLRKRVARRGDTAFLHSLLTPVRDDEPEPTAVACGAPVAIAAERAKKIDAMLASLSAIRSPSADHVKRLVEHTSDRPEHRKRQEDLAKILIDGIAHYIEWPHINKLFDMVFETLPGEIPYMDNQL
jgi:hypothetical protein